MTADIRNNKRIAKNTLALFFRMAVLMLINLYTSRVILKNLGVTDFGIYNVVGGFVSMFSMISNSLSSSISRYITFAVGKGDKALLNKIFSTSLNMMYVICLILFIVLETLGVWFVNTHMAIPIERITAANWVFQISLATFFIDIIAMPYNALIISYERMSAFAYIGIVEALGKLGVAMLIAIVAIDHLIFYAILMAVVAVIVRLLYSSYCSRNFSESKYHFIIDLPLTKEMLGFSVWNFWGVSSSVLADQGANIILNVFFGPMVNAARGLALQVSTAATSFAGNFMIALNPQITKSYATGDREHYVNLVFRGAKFSFFLILLLALPVMFTTPYLLHLWLGKVPEHTVNFVRLILLGSLFGVLSNTLVTLLMATGVIRTYQLIVGGLRFFVLPIDYLFLRLGCPPEVVFLVTIGIELGCLLLRLQRLKLQINFPIHDFIKRVLINVLAVALLSCLLPLLLYNLFSSTFFNFVANCFICVLSSSLFIWLIGMNKAERDFFTSKIKSTFLHLNSL